MELWLEGTGAWNSIRKENQILGILDYKIDAGSFVFLGGLTLVCLPSLLGLYIFLLSEPSYCLVSGSQMDFGRLHSQEVVTGRQ